ncbi:MAG: hypothetical protein D3923_02500 [Candidatus Electrothrix sp. AR3]|nr:hypothetical protein [Candidatus Electrothrix sp. AR3]
MYNLNVLKKMAGLLAATMLLLSIAATIAHAHATTLWCYVENNRVYVEGFFMGGKKKAQNAKVLVLNNEGKKVLEGQTDKEGKFNFEPPYQGDMTILLEVNDAHDADFELTEQDFLDAAAEAETSAAK